MKKPPYTDDSFDYFEAGMAEGELYEVSSSCSDAVHSSASDDNGDFGEGSDFAYDSSLPGPSSGPVGAGNFSSDSSSGTEVKILPMILLAIFLAPLQVGHLNVRNGERNPQRHGKTVQALFLRLLKLLTIRM